MFKIFNKKKLIVTILVIVSVMTSIVFTTVFMNAASNYNYGEALQKGLMFYEFQRSGELPLDKRDNWRGNSGLEDGSDNGIDLTGGWYDAGDHVKFNLPMAYTSTMLAWSIYEDKDAYESSGQLDYALDNIKWANDYFIKCHTGANEYYYQVGSGSADHSWWGPAEVMQMERPSYKVTESNPGSTVVAETAASLAAAAIVFKEEDPDYSKKCLSHAEELYRFADNTKSDSGYTVANGFYNSWSGFYDELSWAGVWLYMATDDNSYLEKAESYVENWSTESQTSIIAYKWAHCWDDVHYGAQLLLARLTDNDLYKESTERNLDYWSGNGSESITYTPKGLAWLDTWGSLRYATTMAFLADVYSDYERCTESKVDIYKEFSKSQLDYALGSTGQSFVVGLGTDYPEHPHHRTAHSSWADSQTTPDYHRHTLVGALVGGPDSSDTYKDSIDNYITNEVACDYNAGFVGICARMYGKYGGEPVDNLVAVEEVTNDEFFVEAGINASGSNFTEVKAFLNNQSGWPARMGDKLSFKYFFNISEFIEEGYSIDDVTITTNYNNGATVSEPIQYSDSIYYVDIDFTGTLIYPGGQSAYKKEIQFRISGPQNTDFWDSSNDYSFEDIESVTSGNTVKTEYIPVYEDGNLVFGSEPEGQSVTPVTTSTETSTTATTVTPTATTTDKPQETNTGEEDYDVEYIIQNDWGNGCTITVTITNNTSSVVDGWTLSWSFSGDQKITNLWSAVYTQLGNEVIVENTDWNSKIPVKGSVSFGFNLVYSGTNEIPTGFELK